MVETNDEHPAAVLLIAAEQPVLVPADTVSVSAVRFEDVVIVETTKAQPSLLGILVL